MNNLSFKHIVILEYYGLDPKEFRCIKADYESYTFIHEKTERIVICRR